MAEDVTAVYDTHSPAPNGETAVPLTELLTLLDQSTERIAKAISNASDETLNSIFDEERNSTIAERIAGLNWHETYHVGQLEILRQAADDLPAFP